METKKLALIIGGCFISALMLGIFVGYCFSPTATVNNIPESQYSIMRLDDGDIYVFESNNILMTMKVIDIQQIIQK